jgi:hypothetical protein
VGIERDMVGFITFLHLNLCGEMMTWLRDRVAVAVAVEVAVAGWRGSGSG